MVKSDKTIRFLLEEIPTEGIEWVQLIRTGKFNHAYYGKFDITEEVLREFKLNFDRKARGVDIAVDYFHESYAEAAGWIREVELRENDNQLWIRVDWTDKAKEKITGKEIRYISADFDLDYEDSETGVEYGATLYGAGLTNRPHVKNMQPIFSEEVLKTNNKDNKMIDFNEILESIGSLSEDEKLQLGEKLGFSVKASEIEDNKKKLAEIETAKKLAEDKASKQQDTVKQLSDEVTNLKASLAKKDKETEFNAMLANGKVVEAQRAAFMDGNMTEFAKNAVSVNFSAEGSESSDSDEAKTAEIKLNEIAEKKVKEKGVTLSEAYKEAVKENATLASKIGA